MKYPELKKEKTDRYNTLIVDCKIFYAFNDEQFKEGMAKTPLQEGEKYVHIGAGAYMPKSCLRTWLDGGKAIEKWYRQTIKNLKKEEAEKVEEAEIVDVLRNHECFWSQDIEEAMPYLNYSPERVYAVLQKYLPTEIQS